MPEILALFVKGDAEVLDFSIDWSAPLETDTIATSTWSVGSGITKVSDSTTTTTTTIWLSGGTIGQAYACENTIVTAGGRTLVRTISVLVTDR